MKCCQDCKIEISEHCSHTGNEKWCQECFDNGLQKEMDDHFNNFIKEEINEIKPD